MLVFYLAAIDSDENKNKFEYIYHKNIFDFGLHLQMIFLFSLSGGEEENGIISLYLHSGYALPYS